MQYYDTRIVVLQEIHLYLNVETANNKASAVFLVSDLNGTRLIIIELLCCT